MWKVGSKETMFVGCNVKSNFPLSIGLKFDNGLNNSAGMWFDVEEAKYLIERLQVGIETMEKIRKSPLLEDAIFMLGNGKTEEEARGKLRGTLLNEDFPTCSYVEEVLRTAKGYL